MGWKSRYVRSVVSPPRRTRTPKPKPAMTTVGGLTHRLTWVDRHAGYRMRCSCGWVDGTRRATEASAVEAANAHVRGVQQAVAKQAAALRRERRNAERASWTPQQWSAFRRRRIVAAVLVVGLGIGLIVYHAEDRSSYGDGYQWGSANTVGVISKTAPSCLRAEMSSSGEVVDSNFIFNKPVGDDRPNDNFSQWKAGCEAGAQSTIASFNS